MGGRSSSSQNTSNLQTTNNIVNDGDYAGVSGGVTHDESTNDNSVDNSQEWDVSIDNSQEYDIDNSVENDGDFAGITGNVTILDGGAIGGAFDFASDVASGALNFGEKALDANENVSKAAIDAANKAAETAAKTAADAIKENGRVVDASLDFAGDAVERVSDTANTAIGEVGDFGRSTISSFSEFSIDAVTELSDSLQSATQTQLNSSAQTVAQIAQSATEDKSIISELAKNTALQGQDIVANQAGQMVKYMALALGVIGIAVVVTSLSRQGK